MLEPRGRALPKANHVDPRAQPDRAKSAFRSLFPAPIKASGARRMQEYRHGRLIGAGGELKPCCVQRLVSRLSKPVPGRMATL